MPTDEAEQVLQACLSDLLLQARLDNRNFERAMADRLRLAQALRLIRDTCPGSGARIAERALIEAHIPEPKHPNEF